MKRAAVSFTFFDDIKTVFGFIRSEAPLMISFPSASAFFDSRYESISISFVGGGSEKFDAELVSFEGNIGVFKLLGEGKKDEVHEGLSVDYKQEFTAAIVTEENMPLYISYCNEINAETRNKLSTRLKEILKREDAENLEIFTFLFDMNAKLDEILTILRPAFNVEGGFEVRGVSLCGSSASFYSKKDLSNVKNVFMRILLAESGDRVYFGTISILSVVKKNPDGSGIYKAVFLKPDEDIKDALVRFLFSREREILKEARI